jgi:signal transduction histidine kinase
VSGRRQKCVAARIRNGFYPLSSVKKRTPAPRGSPLDGKLLMREHPCMTSLYRRRVAWAAVGTVYLLLAGAVGLAISNGPAFRDPQLIGSFAQAVIPPIAIVFVGALIASRLPRNRVGWILLAAALVNGLTALLSQYLVHTMLVVPRSLPGVEWVAWVGSLLNSLIYPGIVVLIMLFFPDGRLPSPRWRWLIWALVAMTALNNVVGIIDPLPIQSPGVPPVHNPTGLAMFKGLETGPIGWVTFLGNIPLVLLAVASLVLRLRRARGDAKQQIRWVVYVLGVAIVLNVLLTLSTLFLPPSPQGRVIGNVVSNLLIIGGFGVALPGAIAVAILKYRLYDIDLVINRTVVFGALAAFITAVYVGIVVGIGSLVGSQGQPNLALSIVATAVVAVAFQPVRERVQRLANRLVYGKRATPYEIMADFSERMSETIAPDEVLPRMAEAAARGVGAEGARVGVFFADGSERAVWWPRDHAAASLRHQVPVNYQDQSVGEIAVYKAPGAPITPAEVKLLDDLAARAGLVLHNIRLTAELQTRLEELTVQANTIRASRQRLVTAATAERQRLEETIRHGAEQELAALAAKLAAVDPMLDADPQRAGAALDGLTGEIQATLDALRHLAHGIYPPLLRDRGLVPALRAQTAKSLVPVEVVSDSVARYAAEIEAAVYFACLEPLRRAGGTSRVTVRGSDGALHFAVSAPGSGSDSLQAIEDRVEALGGSVERSADGIAGSIPVRAEVGVS